MSEVAKGLLHYASNWREGCADDSDRRSCFCCARELAIWIIAGEYLG